MSKKIVTPRISRRGFLKLAGGALAVAAGAQVLPKYIKRNVLRPLEVVRAANGEADLFLAGTDGWISVPKSPAIPVYHPDDLAPPLQSTYMFGFRNVTGMTQTQREGQKGKSEFSAPQFWVDQYDEAGNPNEFKVRLTNLGLSMRPDLIDEHTVHFHGLRNVIPFFDGEPNSSFGIPIAGDFTYVYRIREPGSYMYHCHVEEVEHVHLGMVGMVFVRPLQDGTTYEYPLGSGKTYTRFAYNDGDGSTGFDREYSMLLTEVWAQAHWSFSHVQLPEWSEYKPDFFFLNGRVYPDTIAPNGSIDFRNPVYDANGDSIPTPGHEHLSHQPISSLVTCNEGERVLLRFANLGYVKQTMVLSGIQMEIVGKDATHLRGRTDTDYSYQTNTVLMDAGEAYDAIFTAPPYQPDPNGYNTYLLYNRNYQTVNNFDGSGYGGQMTEVRVYPSGTLLAQTIPNEQSGLA